MHLVSFALSVVILSLAFVLIHVGWTFDARKGFWNEAAATALGLVALGFVMLSFVAAISAAPCCGSDANALMGYWLLAFVAHMLVADRGIVLAQFGLRTVIR